MNMRNKQRQIQLISMNKSVRRQLFLASSVGMPVENVVQRARFIQNVSQKDFVILKMCA